MTVWELIQQEKPLAILSGLAGAAAMAATDWRTPWRLVQHIFVGTAASAIATPIFAPSIGAVLGWMQVAPEANSNAAAFITGAFGIYVLEYALAFWRLKIKKPDLGNSDNDNDRRKTEAKRHRRRRGEFE